MDFATKESFGWNFFAGPVLDYCLASTTKSSHKDWPYKSEEGKWLKVLRIGLPQNRIHDPLFGISVNGYYDSGTLSTRYKIEKIIYND